MTYFVFKMGELTTAVSDEEIVAHFNEVLSQYVMHGVPSHWRIVFGHAFIVCIRQT